MLTVMAIIIEMMVVVVVMTEMILFWDDGQTVGIAVVMLTIGGRGG